MSPRAHTDVSYSRQDFWFSQVVSEIIENPNPPPPYSVRIPATINIDPDTLNLKSQGKWVTCSIELPRGYDASKIDVSSVMLNNTIRAAAKFIDFNCEHGNRDLMVKFDRQAVIDLILENYQPPGKFKTVTLTVTGKLHDGTLFQGSTSIRTKQK